MKQIIFLTWAIKSKAVWVSAISSMPPYSTIDSVLQQQDRTHAPFLASPTYCPFLWIRITQVPSPPLKAVLLRLENPVSVPLDPSAPYSEAGPAVPVSLVASVASVSLILLLRQRVANNIWMRQTWCPTAADRSLSITRTGNRRPPLSPLHQLAHWLSN